MPVLAKVLLAAKDGQLAVTATDLQVELVASLLRRSTACYRRGPAAAVQRHRLYACRRRATASATSPRANSADIGGSGTATGSMMRSNP